ncbi:hypothetical protein EXW28_29020 (plasmid) [Bacillus mycoides]|nr:hypothetical protein EXW37_29015 [Bacillus mycoides]QWG75928.1 hypothetical protein EXW63_28415 [Bacillus mycoides]QWH26310.1 hypothetical protein EXW50_28840 [Bacillus mycoides]QWH37595.1 hypothetical protein EXW28_29020 [Bacillus mycoides]
MTIPSPFNFFIASKRRSPSTAVIFRKLFKSIIGMRSLEEIAKEYVSIEMCEGSHICYKNIIIYRYLL